MKIDIKDLLGSVQAIRSPGARVGVLDDPTLVEIADPQQLCACLEDALCAFRELRGGGDYIVNAVLNDYHRTVGVRFVQPGPCRFGDGQVEPALEPSFQLLRAAVEKCGGELSYWGGNNYLDLSFPFRGPMREYFPEVQHLPWDEQYRQLLKRASWESLRNQVFRFSDLAESFAARCLEFSLSRVLIPSVGLCVHPWLFADRGLFVVATDIAGTALAILSEPDRWPRLYSRGAYERWDIAESAVCATQVNPDHFEQMPDLEDWAVRESLRQRITFAQCDWADLPLGSESVDAIFATNALPRESAAERTRVLEEWVRIVRPGGLVFVVQHNFANSNVEPVLRGAGCIETNILGGERPAQPDVTGFEILYTSG